MKFVVCGLVILFGTQLAQAERIVVTKDPNRVAPLYQGKVRPEIYGGESTHHPSPKKLGEKEEREAYQKLREAAATACQYQMADFAELTDVHYKKEAMPDRIRETEEYIHYIRAEGKVTCLGLNNKKLPVPSPLRFVTGKLQTAVSNHLKEKPETPALPASHHTTIKPPVAK